MITPLSIQQGLTLYHIGPSLDKGPLPSIFYLALSGKDSLTKDPFNQPVQYLSNQSVRIFSLDLPAHEKERSPHEALASWADDIRQGIDPFTGFLDQAIEAIAYGISNRLIDPERLGVAGLSRGGFLASHLAAKEPRIKAILQFAPLTDFTQSKDLLAIANHPIAQKRDLLLIAESLANRNVRFYIGNKDTRVSTHSCVEFALLLAKTSSLKSPQIELILTPSIGQMGHGTPPESFRNGAEWLWRCL